jgi:tetratricopeptide (TPR) repeat protein
VRVWEADSGREALTLKGHTGAVHGVAFSPDGQRLASASYDRTVRVWEAIPLTPELRQKRAAVRLVQSLVSQWLHKEEAIAQIQGDRFLNEATRRQALTLVKDWPEPTPLSLNDASWAIVREPHAVAARYRRALRWAEEACRRQPGNGAYLNTLGVAHYRNGQYVEALASLTQAEPLNAKTYRGSIPGDLAFLAMAHQQLGHKKEAVKDLARLREVMKTSRWAKDAESQAFLKEAEALLEDRPADGKMPYAGP